MQFDFDKSLVNPKLGFVFPGQGSQFVGMLEQYAANEKYTKIILECFELANKTLGYDLWEIIKNGPDYELNKTQITQPALLVSSIALWKIWLAEKQDLPCILAGHSLGEYSALVASGALEFAKAIALVAKRGELMQKSCPQGVGAMAAILGLEQAKVTQVCDTVLEKSEPNGVLSCANINAPGQIVIAGNINLVENACQYAKEIGAKRAVMLPVSVPSHCALMDNAKQEFSKELAAIEFLQPKIPVIHNVDASEHNPEDFKEVLANQLSGSVEWVQTIESFAKHGIEKIIECGPNKVLTGLNKRIAKDIESEIFEKAI